MTYEDEAIENIKKEIIGRDINKNCGVIVDMVQFKKDMKTLNNVYTNISYYLVDNGLCIPQTIYRPFMKVLDRLEGLSR